MIKLDLSKIGLVADGEYEIAVVAASQRVSSNGNDMIVVTLRAGDRTSTFKDYLVVSPEAIWKLKDFFIAIGLDLEGVTEINAADFVGLTARARVTRQETPTTNGRKQVVNKIESWLPPLPAEAPVTATIAPAQG